MAVQVLMSTYNGARYIEEQLASIYAQQGVDVSLIVRDDGSSDATLSILERECADGRLSWYNGANKGAAMSFWDLVLNAPTAEFYAFCDQDDYWDSDKLKVAVEAIKEYGDIPALYFCQTRLVDKDLNEIPSVKISPLLTYGEALMYQFVGGCTMVFNDALRKQLVKYTPSFIRMHDVWVYDVALAIGAHVYFDANAHISYRQHGDNAVGQKDSLRFVWAARKKRLMRNEHIRSRLAKELLNGYSQDMSIENRAITSLVSNYRDNIAGWVKLLFTNKLKCAPLSVRVTGWLAILMRIF